MMLADSRPGVARLQKLMFVWSNILGSLLICSENEQMVTGPVKSSRFGATHLLLAFEVEGLQPAQGHIRMQMFSIIINDLPRP